MNLWHDVSIGKNVPNEFNCIVEIPKNSNNKYEIDKETGLIALDRANYNSAPYPFDYAFVPQTLWEDGDALDVIILTTYPLAVGVLVAVRPVAIMDMNDSGESDAKIIAVPVEDRRFEDVQDIGDLNKHSLKEYQHFFETYKMLKSDDPNKYPVTISGYRGKKEAIEAIVKSQELYKQKFSK
ncbi:MAG: inorganic pyrophosphatase [Patescibacteria group bacterium]|jgi:inorganic pyrophosphatase|nr:inorganic pyrophosphatase [Patescibacteria group bacterium]